VAAVAELTERFQSWSGAVLTEYRGLIFVVIIIREIVLGRHDASREATGTEPSPIIGLHVWDDEDERSPLQAGSSWARCRRFQRLLVAHPRLPPLPPPVRAAHQSSSVDAIMRRNRRASRRGR
jgi:hypothetical protein